MVFPTTLLVQATSAVDTLCIKREERKTGLAGRNMKPEKRKV
jgi:hypothetical protein